MNVAQTLNYIAVSIYALGRTFNYTGDLSANTQAAYNAITWQDSFPQPPWSQIVALDSAAVIYYGQSTIAAAQSAGATAGATAGAAAGLTAGQNAGATAGSTSGQTAGATAGAAAGSTAAATTVTTNAILQANTLADLRAMPITTTSKVYLLGKAAVSDSLGGLYYWDPTSNTTEDTTFLNYIVSNNSSTGRWRRVIQRVTQYPQGQLYIAGGVKKFYGNKVTDATGSAQIYLTDDNSATGNPLFSTIWMNNSRANVASATPTDAVQSYTKSLSTDLRTTTHGYFKPNPLTIVLGLLYGPFAAAPAGIPVQFEITGI